MGAGPASGGGDGDLERLDALIRETLPNREPVRTGGMLGYGPYRYRYATGREGEATLIALSERKHGLSLYVMCTDGGSYLPERYAERLGKVSVGKSCIRFKRLDDLDLEAVRELLREADRIGPPMEA